MSIDNSLLNKICRRIKEEYEDSRVYLFGSYAYGNPAGDSDIDIAVILRKVSSKVKEANRIYDILADIPCEKDIVVSSEQEFNYYKTRAGSIFRTIAEKGLLLNV